MLYRITMLHIHSWLWTNVDFMDTDALSSCARSAHCLRSWEVAALRRWRLVSSMSRISTKILCASGTGTGSAVNTNVKLTERPKGCTCENVHERVCSAKVGRLDVKRRRRILRRLYNVIYRLSLLVASNPKQIEEQMCGSPGFRCLIPLLDT